jgi:hypothetical protein
MKDTKVNPEQRKQRQQPIVLVLFGWKVVWSQDHGRYEEPVLTRQVNQH